MSEEKYGIVYALVNEAMPGLVKIGMTGRSDITKRIAELSQPSGVPVPFTLACACQVAYDRRDQVEKALHAAFGPYRLNPSREFFKISPEQVRPLFEVLDEGEDTDVTTKALSEQIEREMDENDRSAIVRLRKMRPPLNFEEMGIPVGAKLSFIRDPNVVVEVVSDRKVLYNEAESSLTSITQELLHRAYAVQPTGYWLYEGRNLSEIYDETYPRGDA